LTGSGSASVLEIRDVADGLWLWRQPHPDWNERLEWEPAVSSFAAETGGEVILIDAIAPPPREREFWSRLEVTKPTVAVVTKPDHVRDVDLFVRWYGVRAYGPDVFFRTDVPKTELEWLKADDELPGGARALHDFRFGRETPIYLPEQAALVFGDALTSLGGELQVWWTPWFDERTIPAMRSFLELSFEHVLVSHGQPVHTRADFETALERPPWGTP
jgi:hypothetical protein